MHAVIKANGLMSMEDEWAGLCFLAPFSAYYSVSISVNPKFLPKCVMIRHEGPCAALGSASDLLCVALLVGSQVVMPETVGVEEVDGTARLHLSPGAFMVHFPCPM